MTTTTTTDAMNAVLSAQDEIRALEAARVKLNQDSAEIAIRVAEIRKTTGALQIKRARGDTDTGATLQKLDGELADLSHKREGLRLSLENLEQKMAPLHMRTRELAIAADMERQGREVARISNNIEKRINSAIAHHRDACADYYYIAQAPDEATAANLDASHRSMVLSAIERANNLVVKATAEIVNANWQRAAYGPRPLQIVAANPAGGRPR
jgi:chromosome segregation ATPase